MGSNAHSLFCGVRRRGQHYYVIASAAWQSLTIQSGSANWGLPRCARNDGLINHKILKQKNRMILMTIPALGV